MLGSQKAIHAIRSHLRARGPVHAAIRSRILTVFAAELRIAVTDEKGAPVWTRLEVHSNNQTFQPSSDAIVVHTQPRQPADVYYTGSFVVHGKATVEVPPGNYTVVAEHGLEYERVEKPAHVIAGQLAVVGIELHPWIRMRDRGWYSGDMHVHREGARVTGGPFAKQGYAGGLVEPGRG